ncbi:Gp138 family membrane-puncturing spike protein [Brevibacillus sp. MER 51]|uniref:Gp138 family membrane-puncturing spike protein n=1 Tax=Brevibacillus sp. MER 51 TaxID=2939560 RepID=UPI00203F3BC7|nr:Gp138 family membrane-puncturing spike protein [Brevibacillus sp. MER 51]MCM3141652.1 hypothetical protein [Brevibacillus sp. MER 51]
MSNPVNQRINNNEFEFYNILTDKIFNTLRVSVPGIIKKFDHETQTAEVQIAIREHVKQPNLERIWTDIPILLDVPVVFPRGGGYALTFPIKEEDECLVVFSDMCIDAWFSLGEVQNQIDKRRHDLSDAIAIPGLWSQPRKLEDFSGEHVELRNDERSQFIRIKPGDIDIVSPAVRVNGVNITTQERYNEYINAGGRVDT